MNHNISNEFEWDEVIKPNPPFLNFKFKEIWKYRDLLMLFVRRDFLAQYKQTIFGVLWHFIQPIFTTIIFVVMFSKIAKISTDGINPILFYMSGNIAWNYFITCINTTSNTFSANSHIYGKVYFPRIVLPLSIIISNIVKFGIQMILLFAIMIWLYFNGTSIYFGVKWVLFLPITIILGLTALGLGLFISALTTKYRDFGVLIAFALQLLMWVTPVVFPLRFVSSRLIKWVNLNPLTPLIEGFRYSLFNTTYFALNSLIYSFIFMLFILTIGILYFNKVEGNFMDTV